MASKEQKQLAVIGVGLLLLAVVLPANLARMKRQRKQREAAVEEQADTMAQAAVKIAEPSAGRTEAGPRTQKVRQLQMEVMEKGWGKDPFLLKTAAPLATASELTLKGISVLGSGRGLAIINDAIVGAGDVVEGHLVKRIEGLQVVLERDGREFVLQFLEEEEERRL